MFIYLLIQCSFVHFFKGEVSKALMTVSDIDGCSPLSHLKSHLCWIFCLFIIFVFLTRVKDTSRKNFDKIFYFFMISKYLFWLKYQRQKLINFVELFVCLLWFLLYFVCKLFALETHNSKR